jgi:predicted RNA binding protein YcfA (HicA-like mRNA interferase family)
LTWFKHQHPGAVKIPINPEDTPPACIIEAILRQLPPGWQD